MYFFVRAIFFFNIFLLPISAFSFQLHQGKFESCLKKSLNKYPGKVLSVEAEIQQKKSIYEFDIKTNDGKIIEIECDIETLKLEDFEEEVFDELQPGFREKYKISLEEAKLIALKKIPGDVTHIEFSINEKGDTFYEFDIKTSTKKTYEVEVSALNGKITSIEEEVFHIGMD